jgi:hypothetical protein
MQSVSIFSDLGVDPFRGGQLMKYLGMTPDDLAEPEYFGKFSHIAKFVGKHEDGIKVLRMAMAKHISPHVSPLEHLESLVLLHERRQDLEARLPNTVTDEERLQVFDEIHSVNKEIGMYE